LGAENLAGSAKNFLEDLHDDSQRLFVLVNRSLDIWSNPDNLKTAFNEFNCKWLYPEQWGERTSFLGLQNNCVCHGCQANMDNNHRQNPLTMKSSAEDENCVDIYKTKNCPFDQYDNFCTRDRTYTKLKGCRGFQMALACKGSHLNGNLFTPGTGSPCTDADFTNARKKMSAKLKGKYTNHVDIVEKLSKQRIGR